MEANPYAPPQAELIAPPLPEAVQIRTEHIKTEATIKSVGTLYYLGTFITALIGTSALIRGEMGQGLLILAIATLSGFMAHGLRRLRRWTRIPTIILSIPGLLAFPLGTLIAAVIIFNLAGKKGSFVMTPAYQEIIAQTPDMKYKSSSTAVIVLLVLIGILVLVGAYAYFSVR